MGSQAATGYPVPESGRDWAEVAAAGVASFRSHWALTLDDPVCTGRILHCGGLAVVAVAGDVCSAGVRTVIAGTGDWQAGSG